MPFAPAECGADFSIAAGWRDLAQLEQAL